MAALHEATQHRTRSLFVGRYGACQGFVWQRAAAYALVAVESQQAVF